MRDHNTLRPILPPGGGGRGGRGRGVLDFTAGVCLSPKHILQTGLQECDNEAKLPRYQNVCPEINGGIGKEAGNSCEEWEGGLTVPTQAGQLSRMLSTTGAAGTLGGLLATT